MSKSLEQALGNGGWSVSAVVFDLNDMIDDEGRPISERRADAAVRVGVEMDMRQCPYSDLRHNKWMNYSALTQISTYYNSVLAEMAAFRRQRTSTDANWSDIHAGVIDLLAGPAIYLLQKRNLKGPVPAQTAVGHKLAAGFFGVLRDLYERLALGATLPVTVDSFMSLVDETNALIGASEVCAGSMPMIRKASTALIEGHADDSIELDPLRLDIARCLALQVQLGIFWHLYDRVHLWSLIQGDFRKNLNPYNAFLQRKIEQATHDIGSDVPQRPLTSVLPETLNEALREKFIIALNDATDPKELEVDWLAAAARLIEPDNAVRYNGSTSYTALMALNIANYLYTYRLFKDELSRLERELRGYLGYAIDTPIRLGAAAFPAPQAMPWFELIIGRKIGEDGHISENSTGLRVNTPKR